MPMQPQITKKDGKMVNKVEITTIQNCCGALVLYNFFKNPDPWTKETYSNALGWSENTWNYYGIKTFPQVEDYLAKKHIEFGCEVLDEYKIRIRNSVEQWIETYKGKRSYILITLNSKEKELGAEDVLLGLGFEVLVPQTNNPNGTNITLYIYHLLPKVQEEVKSILSK